MSHEPPEVHAGYLLDVVAGRRVRNTAFNPSINLLRTGRGLTAAELDAVVQQAETCPPGTPELLLADARHALAPPSVEEDWRSSRRDVRRAVLLAAIASEVKIKTTLVDSARSPAAKAAAEAAVENRSIATGDLVHKPMKAAIGRSLHEEQSQLFKAVRALFKDRNTFAHSGGEKLSVADARTHVQTAVELFRWLDSIP